MAHDSERITRYKNLQVIAGAAARACRTHGSSPAHGPTPPPPFPRIRLAAVRACLDESDALVMHVYMTGRLLKSCGKKV